MAYKAQMHSWKLKQEKNPAKLNIEAQLKKVHARLRTEARKYNSCKTQHKKLNNISEAMAYKAQMHSWKLKQEKNPAKLNIEAQLKKVHARLRTEARKNNSCKTQHKKLNNISEAMAYKAQMHSWKLKQEKNLAKLNTEAQHQKVHARLRTEARKNNSCKTQHKKLNNISEAMAHKAQMHSWKLKQEEHTTKLKIEAQLKKSVNLR
ncbi:uncharacterized protein A4U43_C07F32400 [Asparagus officinalis]|uniref:Uncharacterized protein n=1 Tax=Asparagus officinalis TaxID=4686 RepID=A0A5P1EGH0_ASPOF|nr:uncharacterized protein A4U43_C07F32400 [Asparagus officinalis]